LNKSGHYISSFHSRVFCAVLGAPLNPGLLSGCYNRLER
jgi:hypothetical protein